ncbi:PrgI family protein [Frankia tisae]|uniref:PrgI family protein n=1 Tax=Frankia tisae TaxID=2950104 RepID=UPI0021C09095|nr:PrgI family protein [Frankia tisae]
MTHPVRIPADVDREDRIVANLTARQVLILTLTGIVLYLSWAATRGLLPLPVFAVLAVPVAAVAGILVMGQRDGLSLDRLLVAAVRQRTSPRHRINAPEGVIPPPSWLAARATSAAGERQPAGGESTAPLRLPARTITPQAGVGVIDLGADGLAVVAVASTVNFALRTPSEQDGLVAVFARYLHSLTAPVQILVRAMPADLSAQIYQLDDAADQMPHPALAHAAREHANYLAQLAVEMQLLTRQVLLVLREPLVTAGPVDGLGGGSPLAVLSGRRAAARDARRAGEATRRAAHTRLARRLAEATDLLAPAGIVITPLDAGTATSVLAAACNPAGLVPPSALAAPDEVITADLPDPSDSYPPDDADGRFPDDDAGFDDRGAAAGPGYGTSIDGDGWDGSLDTDDLDLWDPPDLRPPAGRSDGGSRQSARHASAGRRGRSR